MKIIKFTALLLAITAMVSCQKENTDPTYHSDPSAVKLTASVGSPFTRSNPLADGAASAAFKLGDVVAVAAGTQTAVQYTFNGTTWTPEPNEYLKWESDPMNFTAYYPVGVNSASATAFTVPIDQQTLAKIEQADYMTFSEDIVKPTTTGGAVSFALTRKMARVVVSTTFNDQYTTGYTVDKIIIYANSRGYLGGAINPVISTYNIGSYKHTDGKFYALTSPTTLDATENFLTITVKKTDGGDETALTVKGIPALDAGKSYAYTVKVGKAELEIANITVTDWTSGSVIPGGDAKKNPTITFNSNGGSAVDAITTPNNTKISAPALSPRTNFTFEGWYKSDDTAWNFASDVVTADITLTARWKYTGTYALLDYYPDPNVTFSSPGVVSSGTAPIGVVFQITDAPTNKHGIIASLDETYLNWTDGKAWCIAKRTGGLTWGILREKYNMSSELYEVWKSNYPAFENKLTAAAGTPFSGKQYHTHFFDDQMIKWIIIPFDNDDATYPYFTTNGTAGAYIRAQANF